MTEVRCVEKVLKHKDKIVIFYSPSCSYSSKALELARQTNDIDHRFYDIDGIPDNIKTLNKIFTNKKKLINFNPNHMTKPIVFYKGKFIGGYNELNIKLNNR